MISDVLQKWTIVTVIFLGTVFTQMPMIQMQMPYPMGGYGMMMQPAPPPMPMPMPFPVGVPIPIPYQEPTSTTTTTTTTSRPGSDGNGDNGYNNNIPIGIPVPVPHFVQIAIPSFQPEICRPNSPNGNGKQTNGNGNKNNKCPPCPPCSCNPCTPSFFSFCSPCHQQCRCKNGQKNPSPQEPRPPQPLPGPAFPMGIPMPAPPPIVIVPFPPQFETRPHQTHSSSECNSRQIKQSDSQSCSEESIDSCDSRENRQKNKHRKGKNKKGRKSSKYDIYRRNFGLMKRDRGRDRLVKPVLTYMSRNGEVKMKRRLSNDEAKELLEEGDTIQNVRVVAGQDSDNRPRVLVMSNPDDKTSDFRRRQVVLQKGMSQHVLGDGRKELVFRPPENKKITNLSVSFQITR